mmetsp:Transcript_32580/g.71196  ORF Transcript_32580/g.71196 Transcript_32580/m.71196 type:complete len:443 (-) Transcript_32580:259-1587(-)|eukprot:CAMPEP_0118960132 /NCGR_PEP_ID=MMETSP1169-20130426/63484_1 /TAXON_ID=36882 /ORGANISM="Pyramimonas obovata, Strain CCMP722" /LENGTH=442 /DNA_ID=CAMNT_0006908281 /DNA_START=110 /DNA_END=1438 /DNA_ORIENTATION=+
MKPIRLLFQAFALVLLVTGLIVGYTSTSALLPARQSAPSALVPQASVWPESTQYLIPQLTGLGLNNQLWDYQAAAALAKATGRVLCLVPFLRFYLSKGGQPRIPYEHIFDPDELDKYTRVRDMKGCTLACAGVLDRFYSFHGDAFSSKGGKENTHLKAFRQNTKFRANLPEKPIHINDTSVLGAASVSELSRNIASVIEKDDLCIGVVTTYFASMPSEHRKIADYFISAPYIREAASKAIELLFGKEEFLAIHWRFEETKCRDIGSLLPGDRSVTSAGFDKDQVQKEKGLPIVGTGPLCFFSTLTTLKDNFGGQGKERPLRLVLTTQDEIVRAIQEQMEQTGIKKVYLATDVDPTRGKPLLKFLHEKTHMKMFKDLPTGWNKKLDFNQQDVISRVEQEICSSSSRFLGTSTSSWTTTVSEIRETRGVGALDTMLDHIVHVST